MNSEVPSGKRSVGEVVRFGSTLRVRAPTTMRPNTWQVLGQELLMFTKAEPDGSDAFFVPVDQAAVLKEIFGRPWPAGQWTWVWSAAAEQAAQVAAAISGKVEEILESGLLGPDAVFDLLEPLEESGFNRELLPAQALAVATLLRNGSGGNFSVPGSGKTTMTYALFALMRASGRVDRMLVVAPQSAYEAWEEEARDCFVDGRQPTVEITPDLPRRRTDVVVVNYERASTGATRAAVDGWAQGRRLLVVFDEAHRAKRGDAGLHGSAARDLASMGEARLVLTGTPMPNAPSDLAAILDLAWPGQGSRLADPETPGADLSWVRITKDQLELEPAEVDVEVVRLDDVHAKLYDALANGMRAGVGSLRQQPYLANRALMRLLAAAANPMLLTGRHDVNELRWPLSLPSGDVPLEDILADLGGLTRPAKLLTVARLAREHAAQGKKLLVWTNFVGNTRELARLLAPHEPAVITGALPRSDPSAPTDRARELKRFREDPNCRVLIATPQTLGEGVSLHRVCQSQVHVDRTFNAGLYLQALERTHRVGMPDGSRARVTVLVADGTIDDAVGTALTLKLRRMDEILKDPALRRLTLPTRELDREPVTERDDLELLVGHLHA